MGVIPAVLAATFAVSAGTPAVSIDFGPGFGAPPTGYAILTEQLSSYGIHFSTAHPQGVFWWGGNDGLINKRYTISLRNQSIPPGPDPNEDIRIDFDVPVTSVQIRAWDGGGDTDRFRIRAYDAADNLVDTAQLTDIFQLPGLLLSVEADSIDHVTFGVLDPFSSPLIYDDLTFQPIPEAGTLAFLGAAVVLLINRHRPQRVSAAYVAWA